MNMDVFQGTEKQLNDLFSIVGIGIWNWHLPTGKVTYSNAWAEIVGYSAAELQQTIGTMEQLIFPEDLPHVRSQLEHQLSGDKSIYEVRFRMICKGGKIIWVQDTGHITEYDADGNAVMFIGLLQNITHTIDELKKSKSQLIEALESLENNNVSMESAAKKHVVEMAEQDKLLWTVTQISRKLLSDQPTVSFDSLVLDCLWLLGESINKKTVYIWKDFIDSNGRSCCTRIYEWIDGVLATCYSNKETVISYDDLPTINAAINEDYCLNKFTRDFPFSEQNIFTQQDIKTILIAPISVNGRRWGFIGVDNCEKEQLFTIVEENMLLMSGSILASAIEKKQTDAALREMDERTQIMLNSTPLCCNLWTPEFQNMSCNDEAVRLFELSSQQEYLDRFFELSPEYQPNGRRSDEMAGECISSAFHDGYYRFEWLHQKLDGTPIPAEITLVRIKYKDSFIVAGYTRDLREQKAMLAEIKAKEALRTARDEALLNSQAKSNFLANMSHEIRTPMNAISGFAEIILRESPEEKISEYANGIKSSCNNLINIINDILDITKIESGKLEIINFSYELSTMLNDVISMSRMRLGSKPLMFITNIDSNLPAQLVGDEIRIKQILLNMLSNAIKYTQHGYISLRVSGNVEDNKATLRFSVKDSGIGIKPEDLDRLFEEFERVNTTRNRSVEGTGLGLAISKHLCEIMGGYITVESTYGKGSEFTAVIPQECLSYERIAQVNNKKSVLLYEPIACYCLSIAETLENLGCQCIYCTSQSQLYSHINAMPYDYILTSALHMEKMQSIVLKNKLSTPMAFFTGYGETLSNCKSYTIPFPINCLQLSTLLNGQHEEISLSGSNAAISNFTAPSARVLVVDDNPVNLQVAKGLMSPYQFTIDTAQNGIEAVNMVRSTEYDLVFMDHMMPEMDGIDATTAIRSFAGKYYQTLPIIALTANVLVGTREMFLRENMNDFLAKPIEVSKMVHLLRKWLPQSKIITDTTSSAPAKVEEGSSLNIAGVNTAQGILSVGGSMENYLQILNAFYIDGKQKCLLLPKYVAENNLSAFRIDVHALKSTSATIGALQISLISEKMEMAAQNNNQVFVKNHLDEFLDCLQKLLEAICPVLPPDNTEPVLSDDDNRIAGDIAYLDNVLDSLRDAVELANISLIEKWLGKLREFTWQEPIAKEISAIQAYLSVFDYDGIFDCVVRLKQFTNSTEAPANTPFYPFVY